MQITIVTACPGGHTTSWLAAQRLAKAAERRGWRAVIADRADDRENTDTNDDANASDLIVVAASLAIDLSGYAQRSLYETTTDQALADPDSVPETAEHQASIYEPTVDRAGPTNPSSTTKAAEGARIVGVTACPTGVAHTFMAAEALTEAGRALGHQVRIETQGSVGAQDALTDDEIAAADVVLLACDIEIDDTRFAGKRIYRASTGAALKKAKPTIEAALAQATVES